MLVLTFLEYPYQYLDFTSFHVAKSSKPLFPTIILSIDGTIFKCRGIIKLALLKGRYQPWLGQMVQTWGRGLHIH